MLRMAFFGGSTRERRLEVAPKDSFRHGTYGVAALCLSLLLRPAALGGRLRRNSAVSPLRPSGSLATLMARSAWMCSDGGPAPSAAGWPIGQRRPRSTRPAFFMGALFSVILGVVLAAPSAGLAGLAFVVVLIAAVTWAWTDLCRRLVGGQTGDLIGALHAILEIAALGAFLLFI